MKDLKANFDNVSARVKRACESAGRDPSGVSILAVSKGQPARKIRGLNALGQRAFGENFMQEALGKQDELSDLSLEWHFIGHIQSNKTAEIARHFQWAQSVDREKLLNRLSSHRPGQLEPLNVCLQVNVDDEPQKSGVRPRDTLALADLAAGLPRIRLRGLMAIPRVPEDHCGASRASFDCMKDLFDRCREAGHEIDTLSMGMSADLETAIEAGATMVRVGTDLFGPRT